MANFFQKFIECLFNNRMLNIYANKYTEKRATKQSSIVFPVYDPEEYRKQKEAREYKALNGCKFFDELTFDFQENLEHFKNSKCPYCNSDLPSRKGKSYKCPNCNNKIYRLKDVTTDFEGLFTEEQKKQREEIKKEISRRKKFLKVYEKAFDSDIVGLNRPQLYGTNKENIQKVIDTLYICDKKYYKRDKTYCGFARLRMCRFYLAEILEILNNKQCVEIWLQVALIDMIDALDTMQQNLSELEKAVLDRNLISYSYSHFIQNNTIGELKNIFMDVSIILLDEISYKTSLSQNIAWEIIKKYHEQQIQSA